MITNLSKDDRRSRIRVFIAIELPDTVRARLGALPFHSRDTSRIGRWVAADLLHVTVKFLGEVEAERLSAIASAAGQAAHTSREFQLHLAELGTFPHRHNPRVLWVGLAMDPGLTDLLHLHGELERALQIHGFEHDRKPFSPHITLARLRERAAPEARCALAANVLRAGLPIEDVDREIPVGTLTIMRSDLRPEGPVYSPLARVPLQPQRPDSHESSFVAP